MNRHNVNVLRAIRHTDRGSANKYLLTVPRAPEGLCEEAVGLQSFEGSHTLTSAEEMSCLTRGEWMART